MVKPHVVSKRALHFTWL